MNIQLKYLLASLLQQVVLKKYNKDDQSIHIIFEGLDILIKKKEYGDYFEQTKYFNLIYLCKNGLSSFQKEQFRRFYQLICQLEKFLIFQKDTYLLFYTLLFILNYPKELARMLSFLNKFTKIHYGSHFSYQDICYYILQELDIPLEKYLENKNEIKTHLLQTLNPIFQNNNHIFVLGVGRSGTTWLLEILRKIFQLAKEKHACIREWINFSKQLKGIENETYPFFDYLVQNNLYFTEQEKDIILPYFFDPKILQTLAPINFFCIAKIFPDLIGKFSQQFPHSTFLYIKRDPRNVFLSQKYYFKDMCQFDLFFKEYLRVHSLAEEIDAYHIAYEDLLLEPCQTIKKLIKYFSLTFTEEQINLLLEETSFKSMSGGREYGDKKNGDSFRGGSNWREELSEEEKQYIWNKYARELTLLGYIS